MAFTPGSNSVQPGKIHNLRWWIGGLLFASTVINYIDRQTLDAVAPRAFSGSTIFIGPTLTTRIF
jgi:hypothetical protein